MSFFGLLLGAVLGALAAALILWIVGKLGWGMEVDSFGGAFLTALLMSVFSALLYWLLGLFDFVPHSGLLGGVVHLVTAAVALLLAAGVVKGVRVKGFLGAVIAILGMGLVGWLINWVVSLFT